MFVNRLEQNEQYLEKTFHRCFLSSLSSFGWEVSEEKIKMRKVNGRRSTNNRRRTTDAKWWQKLTLPLARWAKNQKKLARSFNFTFRYIDDVLSLNNSRFGDFVDRIYPIELEIKDTTDTNRCASYLDLHLEIDSECRLRTKHYDKRDDFNFPIVNFPFICSNIPAVPAYGVYISQMIRYSRACGSYQDFLDRGLLLTRKLLNQGFLLVKLKSSLGKCYGHHHDLVDRYGISVSQMTTDMFHLS
jgi:hypothetical protein